MENEFRNEEIDTGEVPENKSKFDVIVVGGGPVGSAAATYSAMQGDKVLLLEKSNYPRDKTCGDAVGGKSLKHCDLALVVPSNKTARIQEVHIMAGLAVIEYVEAKLLKEKFLNLS